MEWNVFRYDTNYRTVKDYNIFNHGRFRQELEDILKISDRTDFEKKLNDALMYYFWCKAEHEIIVFPWCGTERTNGVKFDIYEQVKMNWKPFTEYVWSFRHD